ncbi:NAD(P)-binding domain-containing protein [Haliscomenobacter sp.]|uniref:NAD(P)-binding domain-containing protein n=1 Tax=Haliscomenobacter sp. TaxID=2717303 RepID=UPI003BAA3646
MAGMKNSDTDMRIAILGLGEAGSHFARDLVELGIKVQGWDPNPQRPLPAEFVLAGSNAAAVQGADFIFSVNLSTVSEEVAREILPVLQPWQVFLEMNTSAPGKKQAIAEILQSSGVQFVDLAIMAPVPPTGIRTPMLAAGQGAALFQDKMGDYPLQIEVLPDAAVGTAAELKLLRSIVYKGIAGVIYEAVEVGRAFGQEAYIREQIRSVIGGKDELIDRFVSGTYTHAARRREEMAAVVEMLEAQQLDPLMSKATRDQLEKLVQQKA